MYTVDGGRPPTGRVRVERGIYRQRNGKYAVCFMLGGRPRFRTVGYDLEIARQQRRTLMEAARWVVVAAAPQLRFGRIAGWWIERFERRVAAGERGERTLEIRRYHLERHLLPALGGRLVREIAVQDVSGLLDELREQGRSENTIAGALATLSSIMRFAVRNSWIPDSAVGKLETDERPHPVARPQRALGREEISRLLDAALPQHRVLVATALFTGMRISELLGLTWHDVDLPGGFLHVRAQLSRARGGVPCRRVALKTRSAARQIPLSPQLAALLRDHRATCHFTAESDWVFATRNGTPFGQRNVQRSALAHAARAAGLTADGTRLRFHDLRHTFASHLIIDVGLDVIQVSRILGHASASTTLDIYAHLFDQARHAADIRARMAHSEFADLLAPDQDDKVIVLPAATSASRRPSARERAATRWAT
jgi:integrase